jgi:hypothetical protein
MSARSGQNSPFLHPRNGQSPSAANDWRRRLAATKKGSGGTLGPRRTLLLVGRGAAGGSSHLTFSPIRLPSRGRTQPRPVQAGHGRAGPPVAPRPGFFGRGRTRRATVGSPARCTSRPAAGSRGGSAPVRPRSPPEALQARTRCPCQFGHGNLRPYRPHCPPHCFSRLAADGRRGPAVRRIARTVRLGTRCSGADGAGIPADSAVILCCPLQVIEIKVGGRGGRSGR